MGCEDRVELLKELGVQVECVSLYELVGVALSRSNVHAGHIESSCRVAGTCSAIVAEQVEGLSWSYIHIGEFAGQFVTVQLPADACFAYQLLHAVVGWGVGLAAVVHWSIVWMKKRKPHCSVESGHNVHPCRLLKW